jgi:hypothetical protein
MLSLFAEHQRARAQGVRRQHIYRRDGWICCRWSCAEICLVLPVTRCHCPQNINALGRKARDGSISIDEMAGGTFTISNGGVYGSMLSTPIINPPQSAILGMHNITPRAMVVGKNIEARPMMYIALTYDHRLIDGREVRGVVLVCGA